jgi:hypothetical protein
MRDSSRHCFAVQRSRMAEGEVWDVGREGKGAAYAASLDCIVLKQHMPRQDTGLHHLMLPCAKRSCPALCFADWRRVREACR